MNFKAETHSAFTETKVGQIVAFWQNPRYVCIGFIMEMDLLDNGEWYYTIHTNNGEHSGVFTVKILSSCLEQLF